MQPHWSRRKFMGASGAGLAAGAAAGAAPAAAPAADDARPAPVRIVGVACSPRKGKTSAAALRVCLEAARAAAPNIEVELIELAGLSLPGGPAAGVPLGPEERDDFPRVMAALTDQRTAGIIVATPVYYSGLTFLCKAFLDRLGACRRDNFALADKVGGVLAVGVVRNGGQELAIQAVQNALLCQEMIIVGDGRPTAHTGATLLNPGTDDIAGDEFGLATARNLGRRVAQVALRLARTTKG
ncbi:MAG TPA: flavodoxin family protein [Planctomycetota bacterium]|nr:flavodoxin family protein [Planctomycetota bacterium]OQC19242.1 MAG: 2-amino-4-deoxychorismate dehydrogenase [Planctomycetes bacterium ADurb.Bin069]HNS00308.1 flavodoxin family protein [Planctomycetota bacterium]HNU27307.1 flavodoxin family protein [Planctomycetota bacterium]HOE30981.1 flavodoxin family protein [Planctomycetota bacterium]